VRAHHRAAHTLLHIVAHGKQMAYGKAALYLLTASDPRAPDQPPKVAPVTATELIKRLSRLRGTRGLPARSC
jgi:hypothetical protein